MKARVSKGKTVIIQSTLKAFFTQQMPYELSSPRYLTCEDALVKFIRKDYRSISIVESPSSLKYAKTLDLLYYLASCTYFMCVTIPKKYTEVNCMVQGLFDIAEHISLTPDLWTGCPWQAYTCLTVHYINPKVEIMHHSLCTQEVSETHTAKNLVNELEESLREWGIREKVYGVRALFDSLASMLVVLWLPLN